MRSLSTAVKPSTANKKIKQNNFFKKGKTQWAGEAQAEGGWGLLPVMAQCPHVHIDSCGVWASCALQGEQRNVRSNLMPIVSRGVACTQAQLLHSSRNWKVCRANGPFPGWGALEAVNRQHILGLGSCCFSEEPRLSEPPYLRKTRTLITSLAV